MPRYTFKEFKSDQEVRWCPGCGDHGVLAALQRALPDVTEALGYSKERYVVVSGMLLQTSLLYEYLWLSQHTRTCYGHIHWYKGGQSGPDGMAGMR